jgi:hypothetical protein
LRHLILDVGDSIPGILKLASRVPDALLLQLHARERDLHLGRDLIAAFHRNAKGVNFLEQSLQRVFLRLSGSERKRERDSKQASQKRGHIDLLKKAFSATDERG